MLAAGLAPTTLTRNPFKSNRGKNQKRVGRKRREEEDPGKEPSGCLRTVTFRVTLRMIKNFKHRGLQRFFESGNRAGISATQAAKLRDLLGSLDAAAKVGDVDAPGYHLHPLKGRWKGRWAVTVTGPWRVTFRFQRGDAYSVDYQQYH